MDSPPTNPVTQQDISNISNFNQNYGAFNYQANNPYVQAMTQAYGSQRNGMAQSMALSNAAQGTTDSGQTARNLMGIQQAQANNSQQLTAQDYLNQYNNYMTNRSQAYQQQLQGLNLNMDQYNQAMTNYYQQQAIQTQQATNQFNEQQTSQQNTFNDILGFTKLGLTALGM